MVQGVRNKNHLIGSNAFESFSLEHDISQWSGTSWCRGCISGPWRPLTHICALLQEKLMERADVLAIAWRSYKDRGLEPRKQMDWALFPDLPFTSSEALFKVREFTCNLGFPDQIYLETKKLFKFYSPIS